MRDKENKWRKRDRQTERDREREEEGRERERENTGERYTKCSSVGTRVFGTPHKKTERALQKNYYILILYESLLLISV